MNAKQKRIAARRFKNVLVKTIAPTMSYAADLVELGDTNQAVKELREVAENIRKEFTSGTARDSKVIP